MTNEEKELMLDTIESLDLEKKTKKILSIMVRLMQVNWESTIEMLVSVTDNSLAMHELDRELELPYQEICTEYVEFLVEQLEFCEAVKNELIKLDEKKATR